MAGGRPTKYKPELCDVVKNLFKLGYSVYEIALDIDVDVDTIYEWRKVHPEFSDAFKKGRKFSRGWWMKNGRENIHNKDFNSVLWYMNMKNRMGWKDKNENSHAHKHVVSQAEAIKELE